MKRTKLFAALMAAGTLATGAFAQDAPKEEKKVEVYGNVQNSIWYNTRVNTQLRDGIFNLYPSDDSNKGVATTNVDKNAQGNLGYSAIFSRLGTKFSGVSAFGAKASGIIEADFFGVGGSAGNGTEQLLRLRHAYVNLNWNDKTNLLVGQYWNPNFIPACYPTTPNFALTFNSFSFIPQIRVTQKVAKNLNVMAMTYMNSLGGFSTVGGNSNFGATTGADLFGTTISGPNFVASSNDKVLNGVAMAQFSKIPSFAAQVNYDDGMFWATVGGEVSVLRPITYDYQKDGIYTNTANSSTNGVSVVNYNKTLVTYNLLATAKVTIPDAVTVKVNGTYGQNFSQYVGLGGMVAYRDASNGAVKYSAINMLNTWAEVIVTKHKMFQPAIFFGYMKNMGLEKNVPSDVNLVAFMGRGIAGSTNATTNIGTGRTFDDYIRVAPRLDIVSGKMKIQLEYEWNQMVYGDLDFRTMKIKDGSATVSQNKFTATNHRVTAAVIYSF